MKINLEKKVLSENDRLAAQNRARFKEDGVFVLNLMSSPGSGKTALLEKSIPALTDCRSAVIEGDVETEKDAQRIAAVTPNVVQINTHGACHLSAARVMGAYEAVRASKPDIIFIENIGNLVCPANYDLGEDVRVILLSVTEGDDKPAKYPGIFVHADAVVINKIDLLPHVDCSIEAVRADVTKVNSSITFFETSCRTGAGLDTWISWLRDAKAARGGPSS